MTAVTLVAAAEALLAKLVAIDSVNPDLVPGGAGEASIGRYVAAWAADHGHELVTHLQARADATPSLWPRAPARSGPTPRCWPPPGSLRSSSARAAVVSTSEWVDRASLRTFVAVLASFVTTWWAR